jgi:hypothetical protein
MAQAARRMFSAACHDIASFRRFVHWKLAECERLDDENISLTRMNNWDRKNVSRIAVCFLKKELWPHAALAPAKFPPELDAHGSSI